jgi:hypothetical protein
LNGRSKLADVPGLREFSLREAMARDKMKREACWTESLAVGSKNYLERIKTLILSRQETELVSESQGMWVLQESEIPYGQKRG